MRAPTIQPCVGKARDSIALATARINIWEGAVRTGKTVASIIAWLIFVRVGPPGDLLMVGKTRDTVRRNVIAIIEQMLGNRCHYNAGTGELWIGGRRIYVVGANDERAEQKIRGMTLAGAYCDEATLMPESMWRMLGTRLSVRGARLFATTNPDNPRHWLKISYLDKSRFWLNHAGGIVRNAEGLDLARFSFQLSDNPHLDPDYLKALEAEYQGLWRRRFILGEWVIAEGAIYDMWDQDRFVVPADEVPAMDRYIALGVDYGTRNPFSAILLGIAEGKLWAVDQWRWDSSERRAQMTSVEYSKALREWLGERRPEWVCVDPSAADFRQQLYNDGLEGVMAGDNAVVPGIRTVAGLLSADLFRVSSLCTGLIETFPGYAWDDKAALLGEDRPIKINDHDLDGLRYGVETTAWTWRHELGLAA